MLKRVAEKVAAEGLGPLMVRRNRGRLAVLAYHNVVPDGEAPGGDRSLHLPRSDFAHQLDLLAETHEVISLEEALRAIDGGGPDSPGPRAVVTFDDAYRGALSCGLEEVVSRDLPATVFVAPGVLGSDGLWWDVVPTGAAREEENAPATPLPDREELLEGAGGRDDVIRERAERRGWPMASPPRHARPATEAELLDAADLPGVTFGAHGWSHLNMERAGPEELNRELKRPLGWLEDRLGDRALRVLAYPYGRSSPEAERMAREAGYRAAFAVSGGLFDPCEAPRYRLPRINVPAGVSQDGFRLRALGLVR